MKGSGEASARSWYARCLAWTARGIVPKEPGRACQRLGVGITELEHTVVEVAVRRVKEELLVPELMAELDRPGGLATVGLFPEGKLLCEAHLSCSNSGLRVLVVVDFAVEEFRGQQGVRIPNLYSV